MRAVVVVALVALLRSVAAADPAARIPAPAQLVAKPLEVGQWAVYREWDRKGEVGTVALAAVNRAACGMQFVAVLKGSATRQWIFCVDDAHNLVKAALDGKEVVLHEHTDELRALLTRVLPPQFAGQFTREDIVVPAGTFEGTERKDGATTTWLHPAVPLGAVVQVVAGDRKDVLLACGTGDTPIRTAIDTPPQRARGVAKFLELGGGWAGLSGGDAGRSSTVDYFSASAGFVIRPHVDGVFAFGAGETTGDPMGTTKASDFLVGARWWPYRETFGRHGLFDPASLFLQLTGGYARLETTDTVGNSVVGNGLAIAPAVGWQLQMMNDWAFSYSVFDTAAIHNGTVGFRNEFGVTASIQLWLP